MSACACMSSLSCVCVLWPGAEERLQSGDFYTCKLVFKRLFNIITDLDSLRKILFSGCRLSIEIISAFYRRGDAYRL